MKRNATILNVTNEPLPPTVMQALSKILLVFLIISFAIVGCTIHSNTLDPERTREEVAELAIEAEMARDVFAANAIANALQAKATAEQLAASERMIALGANPIAIRCMLNGWNLNDKKCLIAAAAPSNKIKQMNIVE